jgi:CheY-like chemotaxis protein/two-component sensor histidine kinase
LGIIVNKKSNPAAGQSLKNLEGAMGEDIENAVTTEVIHDFKNILTGILGNLAIAKDWSSPDDAAYPFIEAAERVTRHANQLALQLLASARGSQRVHFEFSLAKSIRDSVDLMLGGSECSGRVDIHPELKTVIGDQTRIIQVLNNLIVNAQQAMDGKGEVIVRATNIVVAQDNKFDIKPGDYVSVCVEDHGVGIPKENLTEIFKMHFTTKKEGSGIGLASCVYIVKKHGGAIHVESEVGKGSSFTIMLPSTKTVDEHAVVRENDESEVSGGRVLVLDDEEMVQQILAEMLQHLGYEADFAADGAVAVTKYKQALKQGNRYDLALMDLTIPGGKGGVETIAELKKLDPEIKAIVSSGNANDSAIIHYQDYGFIASIQKPYTLSDLKNILVKTMRM